MRNKRGEKRSKVRIDGGYDERERERKNLYKFLDRVLED